MPPPRKDPGLGRRCLYPPRESGQSCAEPVGTACPTLEVRHTTTQENPRAAQSLEWEKLPFKLVKDKRGVGNSPIWERSFQGNVDRIERRGETHWAITRSLELMDMVHTLAMAKEPAPTVADTRLGGANAYAGLSMILQPLPAGLVFREPKMEA